MIIKRITISILISLCLLSVSAQRYPELMITYPELWLIEGKQVQITQTSVYGNVLFTVHAVVEFTPGNDLQSQDFAKNIAKYAVTHGYLLNAVKYNSFSNDFHIFSDRIGVSLVNRYNKETLREAGYSFNFKISEIFDNSPIQIEIELPSSINKDYIKKLSNQIIKIFDARDYNKLYTLYSDNALKTVDHSSEENIKNIYNKIENIEYDNDRDQIGAYLGIKNNEKAFLYYSLIKITVNNGNKKMPAYLKILFVDENNSCGIFGIFVNFINTEDFNSIQ